MPLTPLAMDTTPEAEALQFALWRRMSGWEKLGLVDAMSQFVDEMHRAGLARRFPGADERTIHWHRMAERFGPEIAERALGPRPD
jgi:hypothetical protein